MTKPKLPELTAEELKAVIHYDPATGVFTWINCARTDYNGKVAGTVNEDRAVAIRIGGRRYYAHRLAHLYMTGVWPKDLVDHKDVDQRNNCWENLRGADHQLNQQNKREASSRNTRGRLLGAHFHKASGRYEANIGVTEGGKKRKKYLGLHDTPELAHAAYLAAKRELHPGARPDLGTGVSPNP